MNHSKMANEVATGYTSCVINGPILLLPSHDGDVYPFNKMKKAKTRKKYTKQDNYVLQ